MGTKKQTTGCGKIIDVIEGRDGFGDVVGCGDWNTYIPTGALIQRLCGDCDKKATKERLGFA